MPDFYYGCWHEPGHYLWHRGRDGTPVKMYDQGESDRRLLGIPPSRVGGPAKGEIPWGYSLDSGLLKGRRLDQGEAVVEQRDGWTALSFWDSSVDTRPYSCSTFVFDRLLTPEDALAAAREAFPPVFDRLPFDVVLALDGKPVETSASGRWIVVDLGLLPGEVCGDWDRHLSSVVDEETGERVGFVNSNTGTRIRLWVQDA